MALTRQPTCSSVDNKAIACTSNVFCFSKCFVVNGHSFRTKVLCEQTVCAYLLQVYPLFPTMLQYLAKDKKEDFV